MACLDLEGRHCLVVGGGSVGLEKARGLLACGARVTVVSPTLHDGFAELDEAEADALAELLELGLQAGRIRSLYGPEGEQAVLALYRRLPAGRELSRSTSDLNAALESLEGLVLERLTVNAVGPGEYGVTISAGDYELVVRLGKSGARLATIGA